LPILSVGRTDYTSHSSCIILNNYLWDEFSYWLTFVV